MTWLPPAGPRPPDPSKTPKTGPPELPSTPSGTPQAPPPVPPKQRDLAQTVSRTLGVVAVVAAWVMGLFIVAWLMAVFIFIQAMQDYGSSK